MKTTSLGTSTQEQDKISRNALVARAKAYRLSRYFHSQDNITSIENTLQIIAMELQEWARAWATIEIKKEDLISAFTHKSIQGQYPNLFATNYERLEILGDTLLSLLVTEKILILFPHFSEGQVSKLRAGLVNTEKLKEMALALGLNDLALVGKSELEATEEHPSILADIFEALLGLLYISQNGQLTAVRDFFEKSLEIYHNVFAAPFFDADKIHEFDAKSKLQEWSMANLKTLPEYRSTTIQERPCALFLCELYLAGKKISEVIAPSKKKGQMKLAADFFKQLNNDNNQGEDIC